METRVYMLSPDNGDCEDWNVNYCSVIVVTNDTFDHPLLQASTVPFEMDSDGCHCEKSTVLKWMDDVKAAFPNAVVEKRRLDLISISE